MGMLFDYEFSFLIVTEKRWKQTRENTFSKILQNDVLEIFKNFQNFHNVFSNVYFISGHRNR